MGLEVKVIDVTDSNSDYYESLGICQGCGVYGTLGDIHIKDSEECGMYA